jgi:flagellar motor switch protein FliN
VADGAGSLGLTTWVNDVGNDVNNDADIRHWLFEEFSARLATVFEMMAGEHPAIDVDQVSGMPEDTALRWHQPFSGVSGGTWVTTSEAGWTATGAHILRAAGIEETDPASLKSTYLETISQALSGVASALGGRAGHEVTCAGGEESVSSASPGAGSEVAWAVLRIHLGTETAHIALGLESALVAEMVASSQKSAAAPGPAAESAAAAAVGGFTGPVNSRTFELLLDVELPVSVSFGRAQVPLKDVLKLTTGSIVELNRSILEPVEVIVNNCVIARGEVVVVEGNFGVRIHQVISRQERLRTLN